MLRSKYKTWMKIFKAACFCVEVCGPLGVVMFTCSLFLSPAANMMCGAGAGSGFQVVDSPLLTQQIEAQRLCIKHLKNENNRLKVQIHQ